MLDLERLFTSFHAQSLALARELREERRAKSARIGGEASPSHSV
jgi:hypothetical protein